MGVHRRLQGRRGAIFVPLVALADIDEKSLLKAFRDLQNQKPQDEAIGEGVTKELQAM